MNEIIHVKEQTYVFRHLQNSKHEEDVFLAILELLVLKVAVDVSVSQGKIFGQGFVVGSDVGFGFCLPLEPKGSASSVYLFQQLQWGVRRRQSITRRDAFQHTHKKQGYKSRYLHFFFSFLSDCWAENADCERQNITEKINDLFNLFFFLTTKDCDIKRLCEFPAYKTVEDYPASSNSKQKKKRERERLKWFTTYRAQLLSLVDTIREIFCLRWLDVNK